MAARIDWCSQSRYPWFDNNIRYFKQKYLILPIQVDIIVSVSQEGSFNMHGRGGIMRFFLLAALATFALLSTASAGEISYRITGPVDVSQLPYITDDERKAIQEVIDNPSQGPTYVLAISESGKMANSWGRGALGDRIRKAMHICEHWSGGHCGLAIVNGEMAEFKLLPQQIKYPQRFAIEAVPFVPQRDYNILRDYVAAPRNKALALDYTGFFKYASGRSNKYTAKQDALAWCSRDSGVGCFLYDVNGTVVFSRDSNIFGGK